MAPIPPTTKATPTKMSEDLGSGKGKGRKRALLVGICYKGAEVWPELEGPWHDVRQMRELLLNTYGYTEEDIVIMTDEQPVHEASRVPTRKNLRQEMCKLSKDARPGDTLVFMYSGHSDQQEATTDTKEEDRMDELIISSDERKILDNWGHSPAAHRRSAEFSSILFLPDANSLPSSTRATPERCSTFLIITVIRFGCHGCRRNVMLTAD
ncbi:uncharacterized protein STEHIDRAFT_109563 [Stereum hirsutum FP-91666 SS1]|uniref:uncharacterized protein n=1 Tax=Stereum hirsutum (strain FP-91666) TaxID=721885 RepID=UPI000440F9AD|nr:uncharacterized protein STEHIDRAFT_109563 [Stereum hirsutum FP-91666 SS1]EIM89362.1 hypothetical protein STEHIDRAFT_109563 [Stereum hirsutum FP-91666 SS1]